MFGLLDVGFDGVEGLADEVASKIGLGQSSSKQAGAYVLTKVALMGAAELLGIGSSVAKVDMTGFTLAQIKREIEEIKESLNVVLGAPLKLALEAYWNSLHQLEHGNIKRCVEEVKEMTRQARKAFCILRRQKPQEPQGCRIGHQTLYDG